MVFAWLAIASTVAYEQDRAKRPVQVVACSNFKTILQSPHADRSLQNNANVPPGSRP